VPLSASAPSSKNPHSPIIDGFGLEGVSTTPDPATHAYRKDLADVALAGRVIASHYAEPLLRHIVARTMLRETPSPDGAEIFTIEAGSAFRMLDSTRGWGWGYADNGRVGYVAAEAVSV
jgi:hypothetical protein